MRELGGVGDGSFSAIRPLFDLKATTAIVVSSAMGEENASV
jgi:hypothetical protein